MGRTFESKAVRSVKKSPSLRTTIPEAISALLDVEAGDTLLWEFEPGAASVSVSRKSVKKAPSRS